MLPTARISACGGANVALKTSTSYMPRLLIVKVARGYGARVFPEMIDEGCGRSVGQRAAALGLSGSGRTGTFGTSAGTPSSRPIP
jgi:hypothetical protein